VNHKQPNHKLFFVTVELFRVIPCQVIIARRAIRGGEMPPGNFQNIAKQF